MRRIQTALLPQGRSCCLLTGCFGKWLCALSGNMKKLKEKPERDRREFWHSSKAQNRCFCLLSSGIFHYNLLCHLLAVEQLGRLHSLLLLELHLATKT